MAEPPKEPKKEKRKRRFSFRRVPVADKMFFARYLALMLRSGIPLTRALEFLYAQVEHPLLKRAIASIAKDVTAGVSVAESLEKFPNVFDELFINMVRSGETSGNLEEVLDILAEELRKAAELRSKIIGALIYPAIIIVTMIGVSLFIVFFVFPRILTLYQSLNVKVPLMTRILIAVIQFLTNNATALGIGFLLLIFGAFVALRTARGKRVFDRLSLTFPVFKTIVRKVNTVQFARTLYSLLKSGLPTPQALEITARTFKNGFYRESVVAMAVAVRQGKRLSEIIAQTPNAIYPPIVSQMASVGEETGALNDILKQLSEFFTQEVDAMVENLTKVIEPVLMLLIGAAVGFIAIATVQLIYAALQGVQQ